MRLLLWDCDDRSYNYYIEVSVNQRDWEVVCDRCTTPLPDLAGAPSPDLTLPGLAGAPSPPCPSLSWLFLQDPGAGPLLAARHLPPQTGRLH